MTKTDTRAKSGLDFQNPAHAQRWAHAHASHLVAQAQHDFDLVGTVVFEVQSYEADGGRLGRWVTRAVVRRPWPKGARVVSVSETNGSNENLICQPEETATDTTWYQIETDHQRTLVFEDPDGTRSQVMVQQRMTLTPARVIASVYVYEQGAGWTREDRPVLPHERAAAPQGATHEQ